MEKSESQRVGWDTASSASTIGREKDLAARFHHERVGGFGASFRAGGKRGWTRTASRLATHLGRHLFLRGLNVSELAGRAVSLGVELLPFASCGRARRGRGERGWAFVSRARRTGNRVHPRRKTRARCDTTSPHTWRLRVALLRVCLEVAARTFLLQPRLFGVGVRLHEARRVFSLGAPGDRDARAFLTGGRTERCSEQCSIQRRRRAAALPSTLCPAPAAAR